LLKAGQFILPSFSLTSLNQIKKVNAAKINNCGLKTVAVTVT